MQVFDSAESSAHGEGRFVAPDEETYAFPLSFAQQRLWFIQQMEPESAAYNILSAVRLRGRLDLEALGRTFDEVVRRHEVLRTRFEMVGDEPSQIICPARPLPFDVRDLTGLSGERREAEVQGFAEQEVGEPFDLSTGPLLRVKLLRLSADEHVVLLTMHHIISDGWSIGVLIREIAALYGAYSEGRESPLEELSIQYADFAVWQREYLQGATLEQQLSYWRGHLAGAPAVLELPTDRPRPPVQSYRGAHETFALGGRLSERLRELSRTEGATLFMVLLAGFKAMLSRYTGQSDIVVGTPIAGRTQVETEEIIGFFVNALALRTDMSGRPTFRELLRRVRETCLGAYAHQEVPFEKLVEELQPERSLSHSPVFQVIFALQNVPEGTVELPGLKLSTVESESGTAKFDLILHLSESDAAIEGTLGYSTDLFDAATVRRMLAHYENLLESVVENPDARVSDLRLLADGELRRLLVEWNDTATDAAHETCLQHLFELQAARTPDSPALTFEGESLTYSELNARANRLAHHLRGLGVAPEVPVAVMVERGVELIVALLGVLKAGGVCVPLDPQYPSERLGAMTRDSRASLLLTQQRLLGRAPEAAHTPLCLDSDWPRVALESAENPAPAASADNLAYLIYTSGSTGVPKGAALLHRGLCNRIISGQRIYKLAPSDSVLHKASYSFDASLWEIFWPLTVGARLVLAAPGGQQDAAYLARLISRERINVVHFVPSMLDVFLEEPEVEECPTLRRVFCGGEALTPELQRRFFERLPAKLHNQYGPTETSVNATYWVCEPAGGRHTVPIGRPFDNVRLYVLDGAMRPVPVGVSGELYIGGEGLARGYFNRPALTAEKFIPDPFSASPGARLYRTGDVVRYDAEGRVEFVGRADEQVKVRGFRVELGEVEAVLSAHEQVREAVAVACEAAGGGKSLAAFVVAEADAALTGAELREYMRERVPEYMIPSSFNVLERLPLTPNGKADRRALAALDNSGPARGVGASITHTPVEQLLTSVWSDLLGGGAGIDDDFFESGGHSLLATQAVSRLRRLLGVEVALRELFEHPTPRRLAARVDELVRESKGLEPAPPVVAVKRDVPLPLSFAQRRLWFIDQMEPESAAYNVPAAVRLKGRLDVAALESTLTEVVRRHEVLRTHFSVGEGGEPVQVVSAAAAVRLDLTDLGGLAEQEREAEASRLASEEAELPFDLSRGPLLRVKLLRLSDVEHIALLTMHHIVSDGWSSGILIREVAALYEAYSEGRESPLEDLAVQYADFAVWQREYLKGEELERQLSYWRGQLAGAPAVLELPTDKPRPPVQSYRGATQAFAVPADVAEGLKELARREGATLHMVLLAAFQALLSRYTGQTDVVVGTPIANRNRAETEGLIGFFVNTQVMRSRVDGREPFAELLRRVRETCLGAYAHQDVPFEMLVEELQPERSLSYSPIFQAMFMLQNAHAEELRLPGLSMSSLEAHGDVAKFDLMLALGEEGESFAGAFQYSTDIFEPATIERMGRHFLRLLGAVASDAALTIASLPLLDDEERRRLLYDFNDTARHYPRESCVHALFELQAARTPDSLALTFEGESLTYSELNARANRLAHHLRSQGVGPEVRAGIMLERGAEMVVSMLAVLKAGGAYVPLDPSYPVERLSYMLEDACISVLLTEQKFVGALPEHKSNVLCLDSEGERISRQPSDNLSAESRADNAAYVIYTSGSTGRPKGITIVHRGITRLVLDSDYVSVGPSDGVAQASNASFDAATFEVWGALLNGARLVGVPKETALSPQGLARLIRERGVSVMFLTTALFNQIARECADAFSPMRAVLFGGEAVDPESVRQVLEAGGPRHLLHVYGPTECTTFATWHEVKEVSAGATTVPIGVPISNTTAYVLDATMRPVPVGVCGELYVGGDGLAREYLNRPALTAERFAPHPFSSEPGARLYRTGDVVRYDADGRVEFVGRADEQVKVRGFRVELGEVEAILSAQEAVREAVAVAVKDASGVKRVVAYVAAEAGTEPTASVLREYMRERVPEYMIPSYFVTLERLPLTPNGKVDRRALPDPEPAAGGADSDSQPRTPLEELVAGLWSEVLGVGPVGAEADFFESGGHSLLATQAVSRLRRLLGVEVALRELFEHPTPRRLALRLEELLRGAKGLEPAPPVVAVRREGALPLSFAQRRLWFIQQMEPESSAYNVPAAVRLTGRLDVGALEATLSEVVRRHEVLRTRFEMVGDEPSQIICPARPLALEIVDLTHLAEEAREAEVRRLASEEAELPFDLSTGPLLRARLLRLSEDEHVVLLTMHHIVSDGWSVGVLIREVAALYEAYGEGKESPLEELSIQYADFAVWQREYLSGATLESQLSYWREQLVGAPAVMELPADRPRPPVQSYRGAHESFAISEEVGEGLRELAQRQGATLFMVLLAGWQALLSRYTGQADVVVGTPIANRNRAETEGLIGFFVNTQVMRSRVEGGEPFAELLRRVRETCLGAYAHQDVPFEMLVEELQPERSLSYSPIFQVMFALQNVVKESLELPGLSLSAVDGDVETAKFDLTLAVGENQGQLCGTLGYSTDLFDAETVRRMVGHLLNLLRAVAADPGQSVAELPVLSDDERRQVLFDWNDVATDYPRESCVHALFERRAALTPDALALDFGGEAVSYSELNARANRLAHHLRSQGVGPEVRAGIMLERGAEMVVSMLAVLKAGGAYVPLDLSYPADRLRLMMDDSAIPLVLTRESLAAPLKGHPARLVCLDTEADVIGRRSALDPDGGARPDNAAYVIYTSGSTGRPKGITIVHRGITRLVCNSDYVRVVASDGVAQASNASFDAATFEVWGALLNGARLVGVPKETALSPRGLAELIRGRGVSVMFLTTALFNQIARECADAFSPMRAVLFGGEAVDPESVRQVLEAGGPRRLLHVYGPTECTTFATWHEVKDVEAGATTIPIGVPIANTTAYVLDSEMRPVPVGVCGELYVGGDGLARDYLNRPSLTAERFVPHPFSSGPGARLYKTGDVVRRDAEGRVEFVGRADEQVKVRGFRVELGEVEAVLSAHESVREAVAVALKDASGVKRVVAYVVCVGGIALTASALREYMRERVPEYMIPSVFVTLERLPLTPNGKVDKRALPEPEAAAEDAGSDSQPRTPLEELLSGLWSEVLGVGAVGPEADFFELGGHSLLATQAVSRLRRLLGVEVALRELFEHPTPRRLAARVDELVRESKGLEPAPPVVAVKRDVPLPLSFAQRRLWFIDQMEPGTPAYNVPAAVRLKGRLDVAALESTLTEVVRRHEVLRTHFSVGEGAEPAQVVSPPQRVELPPVDLSGLEQGEREAEASRLASEEAGKPFDLSRGPLLRARLLRLSEDEHVVLLTMHHIVSDGWSIGILVREIAALYEAYGEGRESPLEELAIQYADFAVWQREYLKGGALEQQLSYWRKQLEGAPAVLELPADRPRPAVRSNRGDMLYARIPKDVLDELKALGGREGATLFMTLLAAFQVLLRHYTKQERVVVGTDVANRHRPETEPLIGFFVNQLVLFADLSGDPTFEQLLRRARETTLDAYAHQDLPFDQLVEALRPERSLSHAPLFQVKLTLQNAPAGALEVPGLSLTAFESDFAVAAKLDLTLMLNEDADGLGCYFEFSTDLFERATVARMAGLFEELLRQAAASPAATLGALEAKLSEVERGEQSRRKKRRAESNFLDLLNTKPKPVSARPKELVKKATLRPGSALPLVITPQIAGLDLVAWAEGNRESIESELSKHGAILFRGFNPDMATEFERFAQALSSSLYQDNGEHPRQSVSSNVYTPVFYPPEQRVLWHNENSFNHSWPTKIWFGCVQPAQSGGETPVADSREVFRRLNPEIRARFAEKGIMYVRNYGSGLGLHWQDVFRTSDRAEVEEACRRADTGFEWKEGDALKTVAVRPAVVAHPRTGEMSWFNQAQHWHVSCLDPATRQSLLSIFGEEDLPRHCYYGDGTRIDDSEMEEILGVYRGLEVSFPWRKGDVMMIDNILAAHARNQFEGERRIVVAMGDMLSYDEV